VVSQDSHGTYGSPRIHADLADEGLRVGRKRLARLMRAAGLPGVSRRKGPRTTVRDTQSRPALHLVHRHFTAVAPNRLWVAEITHVPTLVGFLYLAVVLDVFSRRVVGWSMAYHRRTELVLDALNMACRGRRPTQVMHHSDQGSPYTSVAFGHRCHQAQIRVSMGSVGDGYDNALCESFFATLACELLDRCRFQSHAEARMAIFSFIEG
jgi:putative transposase